MPENYWLVKQEPESYAWADFAREGRTAWTGVRNFQARNHLRAMQAGDAVFFYHSGKEKQIVGLARVARAAYADPTAKEGDWSAVDLVPGRALPSAVSLGTLRADPALREMVLFRNTRLSVIPVTAAQFRRILELAGAGK